MLYSWPDLDKLNVADGHYRKRTVSPALGNIERANDEAAIRRLEIERLYGRGIATAQDVQMAMDAETIVFDLHALLSNYYWIDHYWKYNNACRCAELIADNLDLPDSSDGVCQSCKRIKAAKRWAEEMGWTL